MAGVNPSLLCLTAIILANCSFGGSRGKNLYRVASPWAFVRDFKLRAAQFYAPMVLPSYEVKGRGIQGDGLFTALGLLEGSGYQVNGVMIFSADESKSVGYYYEKKSQAFLLNPKAIKRNSTRLF